MTYNATSFRAAIENAGSMSASTTMLQPSEMMHVALFVTDLDASKAFWLAVTGGRVAWELPGRMAFVAFDGGSGGNDDDHRHHRLVLIAKSAVDEQGVRLQRGTLAHVAFTFDSLADLLVAYRQRLGAVAAEKSETAQGPAGSGLETAHGKEAGSGSETAQGKEAEAKSGQLPGLRPARCSHHGPSLGLYYRDPDGNEAQLLHEIHGRDRAAYDAYMADPPAADAAAVRRAGPTGTSFDPEALIGRLLAGEAEHDVARLGLL